MSFVDSFMEFTDAQKAELAAGYDLFPKNLYEDLDREADKIAVEKFLYTVKSPDSCSIKKDPELLSCPGYARYDIERMEQELISLRDVTDLLQRLYQARSDFLLAVSLNDSVCDVYKSVSRYKAKIN